MKLDIHVRAMSKATSITILFIALITIWSELFKPLKTFLASVTGHHWVTKGVFSMLVFLLLYFILAEKIEDTDEPLKEVKQVIWSTIIAGLAIFIFYVGHYFV